MTSPPYEPDLIVDVEEPPAAGTDARFVGEIILWGNGTDPPNASWMFCKGQELSRNDYPDLFAVIGTRFGVGDGTTTFNLPDTTNRVVRNEGGPGTVGGSDSHTHGVSIAGHTHSVPAHTHGLGAGGAAWARIYLSSGNPMGQHRINTPAWAETIVSASNIGGTASTTNRSVGTSLDGATDSGGAGTTGAGTVSGSTGDGSTIPAFLSLAYVIKVSK